MIAAILPHRGIVAGAVAHRTRRVGRRLLLGNAARLRIAQRRRRRRRGLCRRQRLYGAIRNREHRHDRTRRVGRNHVRAPRFRSKSCSTSISWSRTIRRNSIVRVPTRARNTARRSSTRRTRSEPRRSRTSRISAGAGIYSGKIVTIVAPLHGFYPAEAYHQDYAVHNPQRPYIVYQRPSQAQKLRREFPSS